MKFYIFKFIKVIILPLCFIFPAYADFDSVLNRLEAEVGIELPVYFGGHAKFSINRNLYTRLGAGFASELFLGGLHWYSSRLGLIEEAESSLVMDSIADSLYSEIRLGYRKTRYKGPYAELGWSLMSLGKGETKSEILKAAINRDGLNPEIEPDYSVKSTVHNVTGHIGYTFELMERFGLSAEMGLIKPVYSDVSVDYGEQFDSSIEEEDSKKISDILTKKVWIFTFSLWLNYIF